MSVISAENHPEISPFSLELDHAIDHAVRYIHMRQLANGEIICYVAGDRWMKTWCAPNSSVFAAALVGHSLLFVADKPLADEVLTRITNFLQYEMKRGGIWHFWTKTHAMHSLVPPDLDDTSCICALLRDRGLPLPHPSNIPLLLANRSRQGLFYSWIALGKRFTTNLTYWRLVLTTALRFPIKRYFYWKDTECTPHDVDGVVNANMLYYLGENATTQPVIDYLINIVDEQNEDLCDKWYVSRYPFYYSLSRNYYAGILQLGKVREVVINRIKAASQPNGCIGDSPQTTAQAACALMNWRVQPPELEQAINYLLRTQRLTGEWPREAVFYSGFKKFCCWGSEEQTTGFCLEALARYQQLLVEAKY